MSWLLRKSISVEIACVGMLCSNWETALRAQELYREKERKRERERERVQRDCYACIVFSCLCLVLVDVFAYVYEWFVSHIWMSHVTHMNRACHTSEIVMVHYVLSIYTARFTFNTTRHSKSRDLLSESRELTLNATRQWITNFTLKPHGISL